MGDLAADLLGEPSLCISDQCNLHAFVDAGTGIYHLLIPGNNGKAGHLYHSETGETEKVAIGMAWPMYPDKPELWGFSEDGKWLLGIFGDERPFGSEPGDAYWLRPVDPPGSELRQFNRDHARAWGDLSLETGRAALWDLEGAYVYSFPEGNLLYTCTIRDRDAEPGRVMWSPDARWLAITGYNVKITESILAFCEP